ncbi:unnamed protein product [Closterium sp. NIES-53]
MREGRGELAGDASVRCGGGMQEVEVMGEDEERGGEQEKQEGGEQPSPRRAPRDGLGGNSAARGHYTDGRESWSSI